MDEVELSNDATCLSCKVGPWPMKLLVLPLGGSPRFVAFWIPMVEKIKKKISCWKKSYIFLRGRITLIKATITNVPVYYMSLFKMPNKVASSLKKCPKEFSVGRWWG